MEGQKLLKLNTSNQGKLLEFKSLFADYGYDLEVTQLDLKEVDAHPVTVVGEKASQVDEGVMIEDTSLEIEGAAVGVNIRWLFDHLSDFIGKKATWVVLLAYRLGKVRIYEGKVSGVIVNARGSVGFRSSLSFYPMERERH